MSMFNINGLSGTSTDWVYKMDFECIGSEQIPKCSAGKWICKVCTMFRADDWHPSSIYQYHLLPQFALHSHCICQIFGMQVDVHHSTILRSAVPCLAYVALLVSQRDSSAFIYLLWYSSVSFTPSGFLMSPANLQGTTRKHTCQSTLTSSETLPWMVHSSQMQQHCKGQLYYPTARATILPYSKPTKSRTVYLSTLSLLAKAVIISAMQIQSIDCTWGLKWENPQQC